MLIYKDKDIKNVTKGAYNQFYKPLGYLPSISSKSIKKEIIVEAVYEEIVDEKLEKPIKEENKKSVSSSKKTSVTKNKRG